MNRYFSRSSLQVVSDIDFTISIPEHKEKPMFPPCLAKSCSDCPVYIKTGVFPTEKGLCCVLGAEELAMAIDCVHRDAYQKPFYDWLATLPMHEDIPAPGAISFMQNLSHRPIFLTNREERTRFKTLLFLHRHGFPSKGLFMREVGDYRPPFGFKGERIRQLSKVFKEILWIDDHQPDFHHPGVTWVHPKEVFESNP